MFRRARLSVKPNVRPGGGVRGSAAAKPHRGLEAARPPEPAAEPAPKPAEPTDVSAPEFGGAEPQEKAPTSSDEKIGGENNVEESCTSSSAVSLRRRRLSSTSSLVKPSVDVPSQSPPLPTVNQDVPQSNPVRIKEKQLCSDRYRIYKAQKLREMLKEELRKEKKQWKNKYAINESQMPPDRSKMTMRDFIYYLPDNNPMSSSVEQEKKTEKLTPVQTREQESKGALDAEDNEAAEEETDDGPLLVPRVKVAEDGSIILDEESLTVEVLRTKGPCVVEENDPIFECGSTTTYSSFRKNYYSKPWSNKETDMFFLAISMVGTDFSMIGQLFPHRARIEIKNKFKREEKTNGWRIDKAFQEKRPFDFDFFAHLLQKVLEEEEKRKQKSAKNQGVKKKSSKPQKTIKVQKVSNEVVDDSPDECVNTKISDTEGSRKDAQTVLEEDSLTPSGQDTELVLEQDQNQKKRRMKRNQDGTTEQKVQNLSGNDTIPSVSSEEGKHKNECQSLRPEMNESECSEEQMPSCTQNLDDAVDLASSEGVEKRKDPILLPSQQHGNTPAAAESSESSPSALSPSEVEVIALCEVNPALQSCTRERDVDQKNKSLEGSQAENVKPVLRGRLQRPKPNLSRAVGKKLVFSQDKIDAENKNLHSETSTEKNHMEKGKMNAFDGGGMENTGKENQEAQTMSNLSEKTCLLEDNQPKAPRPVQLVRGRLQRPKPNVGKAAERKETVTPQKEGASVENTQNESCVNKDILQQMEAQSCKNLECEGLIKQPEEKDTSFQNVQPDEPRVLNECLSIQENNQANVLKQVPVLRTQFQKPKPNIVRGTGRREIPSKEEIPEESPVSGEVTAALRELIRPDASPGEKVPVVATATSKEMKSDFRETGRDTSISLSESIPEMTNVTVAMEIGLKATVTESLLREKTPELIDATGEIETNLEESRREIFPQENDPEEVKSIGETETGLQEIQGESPTGERMPEMVDATKERETDLEESESKDTPVPGKVPEEVKTISEMETDLKDIEEEISQREKVLVTVSILEEREIDLKETGKGDISLMETILRKMTVTEETEADLKETESEISLRERGGEDIGIIEEMVADLEKTRNIDISPRERNLEEPATSRQTGTDVIQKSGTDCSTVPSLDVKNIGSEVQPVVHTSIEESNSEKELSDHLSCSKPASQISELCKTEDQGIQPPDVSEHFSDTNLSKSLPQEQKPLEVKPAPFVRSRFKRPKPNLARAASKKETTKAEKYVPEKKLGTNQMETIEIQQDREQADTLSLQPDLTSVVASREKDKSGLEKEEIVISSCIQTEQDPAPSACEPAEDSQSVQTQENDLAVPMGIQKVNTLQEEMKESVTQMVLPMRARLQRPKPNVKNARHRQLLEKGEAKGMIKDERTMLQKDESNKKPVTKSNSQIESEIEVVSSKVSECSMDENQRHEVFVENPHVNKKKMSDEKRLENKPCVPTPVQLIRRKFQNTKPDLGRAHSRKVEEEVRIEKGLVDQSGASKPEDNLLHQGNLDSQLLLKGEAEIVTSPEVSARKDCIGSEETVLAKKNAQLDEVRPSENVKEETIQDISASSIIEEQCFSKLRSSPQLLKESDYSKTAPDGRTVISSASGSERDHSERRMQRKIRTSVTRGRGTKRARTKMSRKEPRAPKAMLVTLRASQEEDDDDDDAQDFESNYEEESCHLAPEEVNKAPVFVPLGLRSPEPVSTQIEETMEELEITVNVADVGCITVVEHQLSSADVTIQKPEQENNLNMPFEMTTGEHTKDEAGTSDGSTEAAITLLTMGDLVLQSEMSAEQGDVGLCVLPDVHKDKSHIPFSPDNVSHKIVHECQELSSPVITTSPASEENKYVSEKQNREEVGLKKEIMENTTSTRSTASKVDSSLQITSRFVRSEPDLLVTSRVDAHQEVCGVSRGEKVESQKETENSASKATELEDKNPGPVRTAESQEQNQLSCVQDIKGTGTSISQEANPTARNENQEESSQEVQILPVAPVLSSEAGPPTLVSSGGLGENSEPLIKGAKGDSVPILHVPECTSANIAEAQQENVTNTQDLTVNLFRDVHQDGEDEQVFILTLVEIPANAAEEFTDAGAQLMLNPVLPAPILVKSGNPEEKADAGMTVPVTSVGEDAVSLSNSERDDSEKPPANLDLISRKRFHCMLDESNQVPPTKKSSLTLRNNLQQYTSEVCSKELNAFEETGESYKGQGISTTSRSTYATPTPQKEQLEPGLQNKEPRAHDKIIDTCIENMPHLSQHDVVMSDKEERIVAASKSEQRGGRTKSSKAPLSRSGRRPLGFLALICSKNNLMESDEPTQVRSKKRLKPLLPASRRNLKRSNPPDETQKQHQESSNVLPSPSDAISTQDEEAGSSAAQVSCDQPSLKEECKSDQKQAPESEEPSTVSEYFFGDIFIKVDEAE